METKPNLLRFAIRAGLCAVLALDLPAQSPDQDEKLAPAGYWDIGVWNSNGPGAQPQFKACWKCQSPQKL